MDRYERSACFFMIEKKSGNDIKSTAEHERASQLSIPSNERDACLFHPPPTHTHQYQQYSTSHDMNNAMQVKQLTFLDTAASP